VIVRWPAAVGPLSVVRCPATAGRLAFRFGSSGESSGDKWGKKSGPQHVAPLFQRQTDN
jgi:hypothetical protein